MHGFKVQQALRMVFEAYPVGDQKKPELFHYVRTLTYLYQNNYSEDIQIAGVLHDALEDTTLTSDILEEYFGSHVAGIIEANSKNKKLPKVEVLEDIVVRCVKHSQDALIVKMADVYDNFLYYVNDKNISEIDRCKRIARYIQKHKPEEWNDLIFEKLDEIIEYK